MIEKICNKCGEKIQFEKVPAFWKCQKCGSQNAANPMMNLLLIIIVLAFLCLWFTACWNFLNL